MNHVFTIEILRKYWDSFPEKSITPIPNAFYVILRLLVRKHSNSILGKSYSVLASPSKQTAWEKPSGRASPHLPGRGGQDTRSAALGARDRRRIVVRTDLQPGEARCRGPLGDTLGLDPA